MQHRRISGLFLFLLLSYNALSQSETSGYIEIGGAGGFASINIERSLLSKSNLQVNGRLGFSFAPVDSNNGVVLIFPIMIHTLVGKENHFADIGIGQGLSITTKGQPFALTTVSLGYRYHMKNKPFFYRIAYTPLISYLVDTQVQHWAGVSIGLTI